MNKPKLVARVVFLWSALLCGFPAAAIAQEAPSKCSPPQSDSSFIDDHGTAHVTRVVPVPDTLSPEARKEVAAGMPDTSNPESLAQRRAMASAWQVNGGEQMRKTYPVNISEDKIAGVPVRVVTPLTIAPGRKDRVLINLHGGGFNADWGSEIETIPVANLTQTKVIAVLYSLSPEHPFPAALNESVAVYKELLKSYKPQNIGIYGTSAGAILTGEVAAELRKESLPLPGALGIFSGSGDFSKIGDSRAIYALRGLSGELSPPSGKPDTSYTGTTPLADPILSPIYSDLKGFPPTLFLTSGRDLLLSNTVTFHRAFINAGVNAQLVVFDGLWHAYWNEWNLPESKEAHHMMADFFDQNLGR
jgi:acetyl esterase/lipase